jgi:hypothetical protein
MTATHDATHHESLDVTKPQGCTARWRSLTAWRFDRHASDCFSRLSRPALPRRESRPCCSPVFDPASQGGVRRPARRPAADRLVLPRRLRGRGPAHRAVPGGGPQGMTSPVACWHVPDIEAKLAEVTAAGATVKEPARDVGGGRPVATVTDPRRQRPRAASGPMTRAA